ncbi:hypothetical protein MRX96_029304 [Rhipicephalus microplus]
MQLPTPGRGGAAVSVMAANPRSEAGWLVGSTEYAAEFVRPTFESFLLPRLSSYFVDSVTHACFVKTRHRRSTRKLLGRAGGDFSVPASPRLIWCAVRAFVSCGCLVRRCAGDDAYVVDPSRIDWMIVAARRPSTTFALIVGTCGIGVNAASDRTSFPLPPPFALGLINLSDSLAYFGWFLRFPFFGTRVAIAPCFKGLRLAVLLSSMKVWLDGEGELGGETPLRV